MEFTEKEKKELITIAEKHKVVQKLLEELESYKQDTTKKYYASINRITNAIADDLVKVAEGKDSECVVLTSTLFDVIQKLLPITDKVFAGIKKGREDIDPETAELEKKLESDKSSTKAAI
jgi:hypothetical protein